MKPQTLYHIFTEDKPGVIEAVAQAFPGFSVTYCDGYWQGSREKCMVIAILGSALDYAVVARLALRIKEAGQQESVLVTQQLVEGVLL
jgi:hypothetical protein